METYKKFKDLPPLDSEDYFNILVYNCIAAFARAYNETYALDYNGVHGKMRTLVLEDENFIRETKRLKAKLYIDELDELNSLTGMLEDDEDDGEFDIRSGSKKKGKNIDNFVDKETFQLKMKLSEQKRKLLFSEDAEEKKDERDALNVFYIGLDKKEFEHMVKAGKVEINYGSNDTDSYDLSKFESEEGKAIEGAKE